MKYKSTAMILLLIIFSTQLGLAQDTTPSITLKIPIELHNMHQDVKKIVIKGNILDPIGQRVGYKYQEMSMPENGELVTTVDLICSQLADKDLSTGTRYTVIMDIVTFQDEVPKSPVTDESLPTPYQIKPGTESRTSLEEDIIW